MPATSLLWARGVHAEWHDVFLGTTVEFVVRQTHKPVLITPREYKPFSKILIAYDGSIYADKALQTGAGMAQTLKAAGNGDLCG